MIHPELSALSPLMQQYFNIKQSYPDSLLLFQVGDFYELFYDDAKKAAACLAIALTARGKNNGDPIPLCGVPVHALDHYLAKLIRAGFKVALCNQLEPSTPGKVVARGVTQVFTPGTLTDSSLLDDKSASYLFSFFPGITSHGLICGELLTAQLFGTVFFPIQNKSIDAELSKFLPDEILLPSTKTGKEFATYFKKLGYYTTMLDFQSELIEKEYPWAQQFNSEAQKILVEHQSFRGALVNFYEYLKKNQKYALEQFKHLQIYRPEEFLNIDASTQRNLELVKNMHDGSRKNTLFETLDNAVTAMGSRTIKKWILRPLIDESAIHKRHDVVEKFIFDVSFAQRIRNLLQQIGDAERIIGRIVLWRALQKDYCELLGVLKIIPELQSLLNQPALPTLLSLIAYHLTHDNELLGYLLRALNTDLTKEWIIADGFDQKLDQLRQLVEKSTDLLLEFEKREQEKTKISSLKVRYNSIQGYYIEITKSNVHLVPEEYIRSQSLVGKERFTTIALKQLEAEMNEARSNIDSVEKTLFDSVKREVFNHTSVLRKMSQAIAQLDALFGLAITAYQAGYTRPQFNDKQKVLIKKGKHPVVAQHVGNNFIPNDTFLNDEKSLWIITGPNMGGKSTYLRQVALISIMAQCGSFVPANEANLPLFDKIFSRIGSGDNVAAGKSTFLVEMEETAQICSQATQKSLIIFDEVGRGTSTFDGLAIAQSVIEYVYSIIKARCLFATHYHELTDLQKQFPGIACYHAASKKTEKGIALLYSIIEGHANGSFGIDVAKIAHMPDVVIQRAEEILYELCQKNHAGSHFFPSEKTFVESNVQIQEKRLLNQLSKIDYENLSPKQALDFLWNIKEVFELK